MAAEERWTVQRVWQRDRWCVRGKSRRLGPAAPTGSDFRYTDDRSLILTHDCCPSFSQKLVVIGAQSEVQACPLLRGFLTSPYGVSLASGPRSLTRPPSSFCRSPVPLRPGRRNRAAGLGRFTPPNPGFNAPCLGALAQLMRSGVVPISARSLVNRTRKFATSARLITPNRQSFDAVRTRYWSVAGPFVNMPGRTMVQSSPEDRTIHSCTSLSS